MERIIAVCDDDKQTLKEMEMNLRRIEKDTSDQFRMIYYRSADALLEDLPEKADVFLLDIGMDGTTGMQAAHKLRSRGIETPLIFISSMTGYALEGYDVHAYAFLPKPVIYSDLKKKLLEVFEREDEKKNAVLAVETRAGNEIIVLDDLLYVEVYSHNIVFTCKDHKAECFQALGELEDRIGKAGFFRCHRSYLVSFRHIRRINPASIVMDNGDELPISKYRRREFLSAYSEYMGVHL